MLGTGTFVVSVATCTMALDYFRRRVEESTGLPCMIYMPAPKTGKRPMFQFWSWDGTWKSELGPCLETLVCDIEKKYGPGGEHERDRGK